MTHYPVTDEHFQVCLERARNAGRHACYAIEHPKIRRAERARTMRDVGAISVRAYSRGFWRGSVVALVVCGALWAVAWGMRRRG